MTYIFSIILCVYIDVSLHFFSLSVLLKLLKHVKLIIFENLKKVVTRFDKK